MPICRKCEQFFPNSVVMDGRVRNFQNRKYCLDCSPFGFGNNRKLERDPSKPLSKSAAYIREKRKRFKLKAIAYKGGSCVLCGYNRCHRALEFHHVDPSKKLVNFAIGGFGSKKWSFLQEELDKCILVCSNCHREIESGFVKCPDLV